MAGVDAAIDTGAAVEVQQDRLRERRPRGRDKQHGKSGFQTSFAG